MPPRSPTTVGIAVETTVISMAAIDRLSRSATTVSGRLVFIASAYDASFSLPVRLAREARKDVFQGAGHDRCRIPLTITLLGGAPQSGSGFRLAQQPKQRVGQRHRVSRRHDQSRPVVLHHRGDAP